MDGKSIASKQYLRHSETMTASCWTLHHSEGYRRLLVRLQGSDKRSQRSTGAESLTACQAALDKW